MVGDVTDKKRKEYLDELKYLREGERDANQTLDKAILTLTAAAFGLSISIAHELVPSNSKAQEQWLLFAAWLIFTISLALTLVSFRSSISSWRKEQEYLNQSYETSEKAPENRLSRITDKLNTISLISSLLGIIAFAAFTWFNLP